MKYGALFLGIAAVAAVLAFPSSGCTKPNPNVCCTSEAQCADLGADDLRPCDVGQACAPDFTCVAAECSTNDDCNADAPICRLGFCESTCAVDDDCAGVAGRTHCSSSDGACVECVEASQCSGTLNVCDAEDHACRGCERDDECTSGVCIEADGVCADENRVNYVGGAGAQDTGTCPKTAPCASLNYAFLHMQAPRDIVHVVGGMASIPSTLDISKPVILDGTNTNVLLPPSSQAFTFSSTGNLTMENVILAPTIALIVPAGGGIRIFGGRLTAAVQVQGGSFALTAGEVGANSGFSCDGGQLALDRINATDVSVSGMNCTVRILRSKLTSSTSGMLAVNGGLAQIENTLFIQTVELSDSLQIGNSPNSTFRFNTVVCTSAVPSDGIALTTDSTLTASSNIFAYNSSNPIQGAPTVTHSLFDTPGAVDAGANMVGDAESFFVDLAGGDFHLSATSPAIGKGEAGLVSVDLEGKLRPASSPDIGAYERP